MFSGRTLHFLASIFSLFPELETSSEYNVKNPNKKNDLISYGIDYLAN